MKKIIQLMLTFSLVFTLAACSGQSVVSDQSQSSEQSSNAVEAVQSTAHGDVLAASTSSVSQVSIDEIVADTHASADDYTWDTASEIAVTLNGDSASASSDAVSVTGSVVTITASGVYRVSGTLTNGQFLVNSDDDGTVKLILDGVTINNSTGSAIFIEKAEKVVLILADNSVNQVSDGSNYTNTEEDAPNAAIFSKSDLTVYGNGSLAVTGNYNDGITSKDGLIIASGTISVNAVDDGIRGKDYLVVKTASLDVTAQGDALKSDNEDETTPGFIAILGGSFNINAGDDGLSTAGDITINDGVFTLTSGNNSNMTSETSAKGMSATGNITINNGTFNLTSADDTLNANGDLVVNGGTFTLSSGDDAMHSDATLTINTAGIQITRSYEGIEGMVVNINGGTIYITSSDDGINVASGNDGSGAMGGMGGPGGGMDGMGGGGNLPADGGMGPGGGKPQGGGPGARSTTFSGTTDTTTVESNSFEVNGIDASTERASMIDANAVNNLYIRGGTIVVNAGGDGLDANGGIEMSGGTVIVNGPTENMNGALDYTSSFVITGGTLIAIGSSGMAQAPSASSSQNSVLVNFSTAQNAGTLIHIQDSAGNDVLTYQTTKQFQSIAFSSPNLVSGTTYTLSLGGSSSGSATDNLYQGGSYSGGSVYTDFTITGTVTAVGTMGRNR